MNTDEILSKLKDLADPQKVEFKRHKYGIEANESLGIYHKDLKELAKSIPKSDDLAIDLFETGIYEARLLCSKIFNYKNLTPELMEYWVTSFENWEICDSFCMGLFAKSQHATQKIVEWANREPEFEKRASFATIAALCMSDKKATNELFESFFPLIISASDDNRNFVKKAVNWALRNMGKRNKDLNQTAIEAATQILNKDSKSAKWIASNALKELTKPNVRISDYPRSIYRP